MGFILGLLIGAGSIFWYLTKNEHESRSDSRPNPSAALGINRKRASTKEERKEKILTLFERQVRITNDDVQKLLGVADATATNYLQELENENVLKQVGKTGRSVYYELLNG